MSIYNFFSFFYSGCNWSGWRIIYSIFFSADILKLHMESSRAVRSVGSISNESSVLRSSDGCTLDNDDVAVGIIVFTSREKIVCLFEEI